MAGRDFLITAAQARQAHDEHLAGWSCWAIARRRWREWGYASPESAHEGLRAAWRVLDLPVREVKEAGERANVFHGKTRIAMRRPDHPEHRVYLEHVARYQRERRARKRKSERAGG